MIRIKEYTTYLRENEIAPKTIKNYVNTLTHLQDFLIKNNIKSLNKDAILEYKDFIKDGYPIYEVITKSGRKIPARKYTVKTYNQKIGGLNAYLNWAKLHGLILKKQREQSNSHKEFVSYSDYKNMMNSLDEETQLLMILIVNTGMRITEVKSMTKSDLYKKSFEVDNKGTIRTIALNKDLKKRMKQYCRSINDNDYIFRRHDTTYNRRLKKAAGLSRIELKRVHLHAFRHLFSVTYLKNGGNALILQQLLGHKDSKTTAIYSEISKDDQVKIFTNINYF